MIKLSVMDYCEDCPEFEVNVSKREYYDSLDFVPHVRLDTVITCVHRDRCELVKTYLKNKLKEREKRDGLRD